MFPSMLAKYTTNPDNKLVCEIYQINLNAQLCIGGNQVWIHKMDVYEWAPVLRLCRDALVGCKEILNSFIDVTTGIVDSTEYKGKWQTGVPGTKTCRC